jgi:hypothetical protein
VGGSNDDTISLFLEDSATGGNSDFVVLLCAADTDSKFKIMDSGSNTMTYIDADGNIDTVGKVAIGDSATISTCHALTVGEVFTASGAGTRRGVWSKVSACPASSFSTAYESIHGEIWIDVAQKGQLEGRMTGVFGHTRIKDGVAASVYTMEGVRASTYAYDGTASYMYSVNALTPYVDDGDADTGAAIHVDEVTLGAGAIATLHGLLIDSVTQGDTNYAIYTSSGSCRFGDGVDIAGHLTLRQEAEPADPPDNAGVLWCSNGTGTGDPGDLVYKATEGGTTKTEIVVDFSAIM